MALIEFKNVSFTYPGAKEPSLQNINLMVEEGEFLVICGPTGSGKTTLIKQIKKQIKPVGQLDGQVMYNGISADDVSDLESVCDIGMVFQNPETQIVMESVWHELAFGLENIGCSTDEMRKRIAEMVSFFGFNELMEKSVHEISGGQKQTLNLASVLLLKPKVLLLDEPISQLDPVAAKEFMQFLKRLNDEFSITVILSEHRLEDAFQYADRVVMLNKGNIAYDEDINSVCKNVYKDHIFGEFIPSIARLYLKEEKSIQNVPLNIKEAKKWAKNKKWKTETKSQVYTKTKSVLQCKNLYFRYNKDDEDILKRLSLDVYAGEFAAILGGNGAGKSTLLKVMAGVKNPHRGDVLLYDKNIKKYGSKDRISHIGYLAQNPMLYFTNETVRDEIFEYAKSVNKCDADKINKLIDLFDIRDILDKHPYDISGGQQQKTALIITMINEPEILLLDEPTKGLDPISKNIFKDVLLKLRQKGITIVMVTHDIEFAARNATRCIMIFDGTVTSQQNPKEFFMENYFYTTAVNKVLREYTDGAVCCEDVTTYE